MEYQLRGWKKHSLKTAVVVFVLILWTSLLPAYPLAASFANHPTSQVSNRPRAREAGVKVGILPVGPRNAITDVAGVAVGHSAAPGKSVSRESAGCHIRRQWLRQVNGLDPGSRARRNRNSHSPHFDAQRPTCCRYATGLHVVFAWQRGRPIREPCCWRD